MYQATDQLLTLEELEQASATVQASSLAVFRTPSVLAKTSSTCGPVRYVQVQLTIYDFMSSKYS